MRLLPRSLGIVAPVSLFLLFATLTGPSSAGAQYADHGKAALVKNIENMSGHEVAVINPETGPIQIQTASSREVSKVTFRQLTGESSGHRSMSTYPDVTLINTSQKTIKSLMLIVHSRVEAEKSGHGVLTKDLSLHPGDAFVFPSGKWPQAERVTTEQDGKFAATLRQPRLDSPKTWLPGSASDLTVVVGMVVFDDGTQWKLPDSFSW